MRVRLVQEGPINVDEFWECAGDLELLDGEIVGLRGRWDFDEALECRLVQAVQAFVEAELPGARVLWNALASPRGDQVALLVLAPNRRTTTKGPLLICENADRGLLATELAQRVKDYLASGVELVWVLYPYIREVHVFEPGPSVRVVSSSEVLDGGNVLPGFQLASPELWGA